MKTGEGGLSKGFQRRFFILSEEKMQYSKQEGSKAKVACVCALKFSFF